MYLQRPATTETAEEQDWPVVLDTYGVQFLALDIRADGGLLQLFRSDRRWRVIFEDEEAVLFGREEAAPAAYHG
jgi:hypothetical protein